MQPYHYDMTVTSLYKCRVGKDNMITLEEYNRRFHMIVQAFESGYLTKEQAIDAMKELSNQEVKR